MIINRICKGGGGSSGTPIQIASASEMDSLLTTANIGKAFLFIGETDEHYTNGDIYVVEMEE